MTVSRDLFVNISNTHNRDKIEPYCRLSKTDNSFEQFKELKRVIQTNRFSPYFQGSFIPSENSLIAVILGYQ